MSDALLGLQVKLPTDCKCGSEIAVIGPGNGKHAATLKCSQCGSGRGAISQFTAHFIESVAARYGAPTTIVIRASAIAATYAGAEVQR
jgi:hypothetical protein